MPNEPQYKLGSVTGDVDFSGLNFSGHSPAFSVEQLLGHLNEMFANVRDSVDEVIKDRYRKQLNEAALANGDVITARERKLIEKAVNGAITQVEVRELISRFPFKHVANQAGLTDKTVGELIKLVSQPLSPGSAAVAVELRNRASVDGNVSTELNALLNYARLNGGLTASQQARLYQLLQPEDAL